jgi:4-amino-4-deoxychorismate lyase
LNVDNFAGEEYILKCLQEYEIHNCILKVIVTEKNIVMSTRQSVYKPEDYSKGFKVKLSSLKRNPYSHTAYIKSLNYTDNILEKERASGEGFDEVFFLNTHGEIAEGSVSNIFFVKDKKIYTPAIECGILDGIVRGWVINNFSVCVGRFVTEDITKADEVFITNSVMGIMKVKHFEGIDFSDGSIFELVRDNYEEHVSGAASIINSDY